jgi:lipoprotein-anchoring transpeptidase ErfK/SrfK
MKNINIRKVFRSKQTGNVIILISSVTLVYLLISIYFTNHFFFNTVINGVDVSLKKYDKVDDIIRVFVKEYELQLIERKGEIEEISGQDIEMQYNEKNSISKTYHMRSPFKWISSLLKGSKYLVEDLYVYNKNILANKINELNCVNKEIIEPQNVSFKYSKGSYEVIDEVLGNKLNKDRLNRAIEMSILKGETKLNLNENNCYENPEYLMNSDKTIETKNLLNKYISTEITYIFGAQKEKLDGDIINEWLSIDAKLNVTLSEMAAIRYVRSLSKKYDTVGIARNFKTSIGKKVEVSGGLYGWKINQTAETKVLLEEIKLGEKIEKEPIYLQKTLSRDKDEIGNTYVEVNITKQHLWFYKNGKLITQGDVVTGNPNRGNATVVGTYMLNYKQKGANLTGPGYEAEVTYWMPFFGNIGIHDASWRYSFGGEIYKRRGTHGCVNVPLYLAKTIFENIEDGTPIICYEE